MTTSAILAHGGARFTDNLVDVVSWMEEREHQSIEQMPDSKSQFNVANPATFERDHSMNALDSFTPQVR